MAPNFSKLIIGILCDNQGCLDFGQLNELAHSHFGFEVEDLQSILFDDGLIAIQEDKQQVSGLNELSPEGLVVAKTALRICQKKYVQCAKCDGLHLCKYFVCGGCTFGPKCKNPHSLDSPHNTTVLERFGLQELTEKQLFQLLLQNDPYLLPEVCSHYNKGNGPFGSCQFTTSCTKLHMCQHSLQGDCRFGSSCKRNHQFTENEMKLFRGYSEENIQNLYKIYKNKLIIMGKHERQAVVLPAPPKMNVPQPPPCNPGSPTKPVCPKPVSAAGRNEILHNICTSRCFKEACGHVHWGLPYKWEVLDQDCVTWKELPNMEDIEKAYSDPSRDTSAVCLPPSASRGDLLFKKCVDFKTMTYGGSKVRRLPTASSVLHPSHFTLPTQWVWYWQHEKGSWLEYGQGGGDVTVTSHSLEKMYLENREKEIAFQAGEHKYVLHLNDAAGTQQMFQQNVEHKTKREVRRRPRFVSAEDVKKAKNSSSSSTDSVVPSHWDKKALPDLGFEFVLLSSSSPDHNMIQTLFKCTMRQSKIKSIQRIQNPSLWKSFHCQKEQMQKTNGGKTVDERYLFHGTDERLVDEICDQNFDWRVCGSHGTVYGKGSYFAKDASYSNKYSRAKGGRNKVMFVALVLVGEYTLGRHSYVRPPPKKGSRTLYDSCVNSETNPSIFVIFEKQQIYPEYLIMYQ
ncbi:poly(ADP-ribose) polymerase family member 12 [Nothobranchius furzeri]|uniref:Poly(ADP-ribose) polymerase family member 12 n=1 Tax=Nothobranchius furzeri TaxID=105023 RepID=A0A9D3BW58_NOTFU|nr:poly(ADP-ribose) polymerase family member 12 [Nothobranchius furzeri]